MKEELKIPGSVKMLIGALGLIGLIKLTPLMQLMMLFAQIVLIPVAAMCCVGLVNVGAKETFTEGYLQMREELRRRVAKKVAEGTVENQAAA